MFFSRPLYFVTSFFALIAAGCSTIPSGVPVSALKQVEAKQAFDDLLSKQETCVDQIDADILVTFESLFFKGKVSGYLQAMQPAYLRFDGLNPFGLTEFILTTDGTGFTFLAVRGQTAYDGPISAKKIQQYVPQALSDDFIFLLNGFVPVKNTFVLGAVRGEKNGNGFWLDLEYPDTPKGMKILFQADKQEIEKIIITSSKGQNPTVLSYQYPKLSDGICNEPESIHADTNGSGMSISFSKRYSLTSLKEDHFKIAVPSNYKKVLIQ